jgi:hypothetical protein
LGVNYYPLPLRHRERSRTALDKLVIKALTDFEYDDDAPLFTLVADNIAPSDLCGEYVATGLVADNVEIYCEKLKDGNWSFEVNAFVSMKRLPESVPVRVTNKIVSKEDFTATVNQYRQDGYEVLDENGCEINFEDLGI